MLDLNKSPLSVLVAEFNKLTGGNVKRFPDRKTAIKRLQAVMPKTKPTLRSNGSTKREMIAAFISTPRSIDEICETFGIKKNTAFTYLADMANPKYCGKALGSPVKIERTEDGKVVRV